MQLVVDGKLASTFEVNAPAAYKRPAHKPDLAANAGRAVPAMYETKVHLEPGEHRLAARFLNDAYFPQDPDENYQDRNLFVQALEVVDLSAPPCPPMPQKIRALFVKHAGAPHRWQTRSSPTIQPPPARSLAISPSVPGDARPALMNSIA